MKSVYWEFNAQEYKDLVPLLEDAGFDSYEVTWRQSLNEFSQWHILCGPAAHNYFGHSSEKHAISIGCEKVTTKQLTKLLKDGQLTPEGAVMSKLYAVKVNSYLVRNMLLELASQKGYNTSSVNNNKKDREMYLLFGDLPTSSPYRVGWCSNGVDDHEWMSTYNAQKIDVETVIDMLQNGKLKPRTYKSFTVGEYTFTVDNPDQVKIGCTTVYKDTIEEILKAMKELME
jgi:hypothetical protein